MCVLRSGILHRTSGKSMIVRSQCNSCYGSRFRTVRKHRGRTGLVIRFITATAFRQPPTRDANTGDSAVPHLQSKLFYGSVQNLQCNNRPNLRLRCQHVGFWLSPSLLETKRVEATCRVCPDLSSLRLRGLNVFPR
jgi:hypothetical protein